jgi:hypothetical protein
MAEDFGYCWRTVRLYCPAAPTFLAREWVNTAWKQLLSARRWGFMRGELRVTTTGTSTTTQVFGPARLAVMRLGASRLAYTGEPLEQTYVCPGDTHMLLPADFASFVVVADLTRQLRLPFRYSLDELLTADPALNTTGQPLGLIATTPDPTTGLPRYRLHPSGTAVTITAIYNRQGARLTDGDVFTGVLADGAEVLVAGALAQAALWPGTGDKPNPYFNAGLAQAKATEFKVGVQTLSLRDDEQYPDDLWDNWGESCTCLGQGGDPRTTDASAAYF